MLPHAFSNSEPDPSLADWTPRAQLSPHGTCGLKESLFLQTFGAAQGKQAGRCVGGIGGEESLRIPSR